MATPFIDVNDLTDYLGRDVTADDGAVIACDAACEIVRTLAEQTFSTETGGTIILDGTGTDCLLLPQLPITSAGTVIENGATLTENEDYALSDGGKLIRLGGGTVTYTTFTGYETTWPTGRRNVQVVYDHGYPGGSVPTDVRMVALALAHRLVTQGPAAMTESVAGQSVGYAGPAMNLTTGEMAILRKYRPR